jgi:hypothetical protein
MRELSHIRFLTPSCEPLSYHGFNIIFLYGSFYNGFHHQDLNDNN